MSIPAENKEYTPRGTGPYFPETFLKKYSSNPELSEAYDSEEGAREVADFELSSGVRDRSTMHQVIDAHYVDTFKRLAFEAGLTMQSNQNEQPCGKIPPQINIPVPLSKAGMLHHIPKSTKSRRVVKYERGALQEKHLSTRHITERLAKTCCRKMCLTEWSIDEVQSVRTPYWGAATRDIRDDFLNSVLKQREPNVVNDGGKGYILLNKHLCKQGLINVLGISNKTLYRSVHVVVHNRPEAAFRGNAWQNRHFYGVKRAAVIGWLACYTSLRGSVGDWQPDKSELHLAHSQKKQIYHCYLADSIILGTDAAERTYFGRVFSKFFPHVRIHKWKNFAKCSTCSKLDGRLCAAQSRVGLKEVRNLIWKHLAVVYDQKQKHWKHVHKAKKMPTRYMATSHDGMDTYKSTVVHYPRTPKEMSDLQVLKMHVMGVLTHGHAPHAYAYVSPPGVGTGACMSIETLMRVMIRMKECCGYVPPIWYAQADNTAAEFKNSVSFMFLGLLVQIGMFEKVCYLLYCVYNKICYTYTRTIYFCFLLDQNWVWSGWSHTRRSRPDVFLLFKWIPESPY
jgi:hypothetical protein